MVIIMLQTNLTTPRSRTKKKGKRKTSTPSIEEGGLVGTYF